MFEINGIEITMPNGFKPQRVPRTAASITTLSGRVIADVRGWKYADMTLKWGYIPMSELQYILAQTASAFTVSFDDMDGTEHTVSAVKTGISGQRKMAYEDGVPLFMDVEMGVSFPDVYDN